MWMYPNVIQPLFNEFRPLQARKLFVSGSAACKHRSQDESLKEKIEALAAEAMACAVLSGEAPEGYPRKQ